MIDLEAAYRNSPLFAQLEAVGTGKRPMPESQARRHHYNPRLIIRGFVGRARDGSQQLYRLDVRSGKPQRTSVDNAGSELRYYRFNDEGGRPHNRVEAFFSIVEDHAAAALIRLLTAPHALSAPDRATLSFFFALLDGRTPAGTARMAASSDTIMRLMLAAECADSQAFDEQYRELLGKESATEMEDVRLRMVDGLSSGEISFENPKARGLEASVRAAGSVCQDIFMMRWTVLRTRGCGFVTSDRALAMHDPTPRYPWSAQAWASSPGVEVTIPLRSDVCLRITPGPPVTEERAIGRGDVECTNLRTYGWAQRYVYGQSQQCVANLRSLAKSRPRDVVRPRSPKQVLLIAVDPSDNGLRDEHRRRGWPERLVAEGVEHDYVVLDSTGDPVETVQQAHCAVELAKRRGSSGPGPSAALMTDVDPRSLA